MASRDHFSIPISCPNCSQAGKLNVSENDYDFMKKNDRQIISIEGDFAATIVGDTESKVICNKCKYEFNA